MKQSQRTATVLVLFGLLLHTYEGFGEASSFSVGFWLWSLSPYIVGAVLLWLVRQSHAAVGTLALPAVMDVGNFYSVLVSPQSSTAALGMIFVPLWNLVLLAPIGGAVGWWVGHRVRQNAL